MKKNTKILFIVFGIIALVIIVYFLIKHFTISPYTIEEENNQKVTKYSQENFEKLVTEDLSGYGYEVINVGKMNDYVDINKSWVYVEMKSLGDINEQAWYGFISLGSHSSVAGFNVGKYSVSILTPTSECYYAIDENIWDNYKASAHGDKIYYTNGTEANGKVAEDYIDYIIKTETKRCI